MPNILFYFIIIFFFLFNYQSFAENDVNKIKLEIGKSYKIKGKWYYPKNNLDYNEIGIASVNSNSKVLSFVSSTKNKKKTKNGEFFSNEEIVAKHKTLALPTIARVTNLHNGYSINVRINDRGPKNNFRIIELSKKTAEYLKIKTKALVEIKVISNLTMQEQNKLKQSFLKNNEENLEKDIALAKELVEIEDLMDKKKEKSVKKEYVNLKLPEEKQKLKFNYKKKKIQPYYLRVNIKKFKKFNEAKDLKEKMKPIYEKILISLILLNGEKHYKVTTVPIKNLKEAEYILSVIHKKGFNNAKLFIERKKK